MVTNRSVAASSVKAIATYHKSEAGTILERNKNFDRHQERLWEIKNAPREMVVMRQVDNMDWQKEAVKARKKMEYATQRKLLSVS